MTLPTLRSIPALGSIPPMLMSMDQKSAYMWDQFIKGNYGVAERLAKELVVARRDHPQARTIQAVLAWRRGEEALGLKLVEMALAAAPQNLDILRVGARQSMEAGMPDKAIALYRRACAAAPGLKTTIDLALALLQANQYEEGWRLYESRVQRELGVQKFKPAKPQWDGRPVDRLLILREAGFGDMIQMARFIPALPAKYKVFWVPAALGRLIEAMDIEVCTVPAGQPLPAHDAWVFHMSMPNILSLTSESVQGAAYMGAPGVIPASLNRRAGRPAVGVVWGGSPAAPRDRLRSLSGEHLSRLMVYDKVDWWVLQQGPYLRSLRPYEGLGHVFVPEIKDFYDTAATILSLDLVVTVDTSVAHLTGALGKPCWVLVSTTPDMRYPGRGPTTPWYDSLRLYRQPRPGDWQAVIDKVLLDLEAEL